ncbi:uncharacterized protein [Montipora capricornis]|uniref:uncharacterized protein n=1 Tax=Montipora capricornis TaxID=246305 RepID=UPI0035F189C4
MAKTEALKLKRGSYDANMVLSDDMKSELQWWVDNLETATFPISNGNPDIVIDTDASLIGWGAVCNAVTAQASFTPSDVCYAEGNFNALELLAIKYGLQSFATIIKNRHILEADFGSRNFNDRTEWSLDPSTFELITKKLGQPEIDLLASYSNDKVACYYSWKPDPGAAHADAFTVSWSGPLTYCFPPFSLLGRCLQKIAMDQAECIVLIPNWPTQPYYSRVMDMLVRLPLVLPIKSTTVTSASTRSSPSASTVPKASTAGMQIIRKSLESQNISGHSAEIILASWRSGTQKQYQTYINKWLNYCCERELDSIHASVADVIQGPVARRLTLSPVASLSWKNLSLKLVMLLSLVTAQGGQTLHLLDISLMSTYDSSIVFTFSKPLKQSNPRTQEKPLVLNEAYTHDESLCVFSTLKEYLQRTKTLRVTAGSQLLIGFQKPHKAVLRDTISRWVRTVMQMSGINLNVYKAHSTRTASVSPAHRAQVTIQEILSKAGWSSAQTFAIYNNKNLDTSESSASQFQEAILTLQCFLLRTL